MIHLKNTWYIAAWDSEVEAGKVLARKIADIHIALFRKEDAAVAALHDRCPHRYAPLSQGQVESGTLTCPYHGLGFGADGICTKNPYGRAGEGMKVKNFATVERHSAIWIWLGDTATADPKLIPDWSFIDAIPAEQRHNGYLHVKAHYQLLSDNLLDIVHPTFLHSSTIGGDLFWNVDLETNEDGDDIVVVGEAFDREPPPVIKPFMEGNGDFKSEARWQVPAHVRITNWDAPTGTPFEPDTNTLTQHSLTPESDGSTHYFYCFIPPEDMRTNPELIKGLGNATDQIFGNEDLPLLEGQHDRLDDLDLLATRPRLLPFDKGIAMARRKLSALIMKAEA